jgi:hypothetical protein
MFTFPQFRLCILVKLQSNGRSYHLGSGKELQVQLGAKVRFQPPLSDLYHPTDHHGGILVSAKRSV